MKCSSLRQVRFQANKGALDSNQNGATWKAYRSIAAQEGIRGGLYKVRRDTCDAIHVFFHHHRFIATPCLIDVVLRWQKNRVAESSVELNNYNILSWTGNVSQDKKIRH